MGHEVDHGLCIGDRMYVCNMFVLPTMTQGLLNKKNKKGHLWTAGKNAENIER